MSLLETFLVKVESFVLSISADVPVETDWAQSSYGSWYNAPRQHGLELLFLANFYALATFLLFKYVMQPRTKYYRLLSEFKTDKKPTWTERAMTVALASSLSLTLIHKIIRNRVWFMLQPCHISGLLLVFALLYPNKKSFLPHIFFNIYLHLQWGAMAALAFPDLREHVLIGETFNFFAEHILLLIVPVYMIYSGRYAVLPKSKGILFLSFFTYCFFHTPVLHTLSLTSGFNLNYMWTPPPIPLLLSLGPAYRIVMYGIAFLLKFITRFVLVESVLTLLSYQQQKHIKNPLQKSVKKSKKIN